LSKRQVKAPKVHIRDSGLLHALLHLPAQRDIEGRPKLVVRGGRRLGSEIKRTTTPAVTPSMRSALRDLRLTELTVVHAGAESFQLAGHVRAVSASALVEEIRLAAMTISIRRHERIRPCAPDGPACAQAAGVLRACLYLAYTDSRCPRSFKD
jgi:hypothetical protein